MSSALTTTCWPWLHWPQWHPCSTLQKSLLEFGHLLTFRDVQTPLDASTWPKCACLVGSSETNSLAYSEEINLSLLVLLPGCRLPQSVETKADMVVEVLKSGEGAKIGPTEETVRDVAEGTILSYVHTAPKVIKVGEMHVHRSDVRAVGDLKSVQKAKSQRIQHLFQSQCLL